MTVNYKWPHNGTMERRNTLLPPANEVCKGYVFTSVCHSVHGGVSASVHAGIHTPPGADTPRADTLPEQTPPGQGADPSGSRPPGGRWLLLRAVRILLECILVRHINSSLENVAARSRWPKMQCFGVLS